MATETQTIRPAELRAALATYREKLTQSRAAIDHYSEAPDDFSGGERRDAMCAAVSTTFDAEKTLAEMVASLVGQRPEEDSPVAVILDGLPIVAYLDDSDDVCVAVPDINDVVTFSPA
jgi:hypothetical protein